MARTEDELQAGMVREGEVVEDVYVPESPELAAFNPEATERKSRNKLFAIVAAGTAALTGAVGLMVSSGGESETAPQAKANTAKIAEPREKTSTAEEFMSSNLGNYETVLLNLSEVSDSVKDASKEAENVASVKSFIVQLNDALKSDVSGGFVEKFSIAGTPGAEQLQKLTDETGALYKDLDILELDDHRATLVTLDRNGDDYPDVVAVLVSEQKEVNGVVSVNPNRQIFAGSWDLDYFDHKGLGVKTVNGTASFNFASAKEQYRTLPKELIHTERLPFGLPTAQEPGQIFDEIFNGVVQYSIENGDGTYMGLVFPSDNPFDTGINRVKELRAQGLQPEIEKFQTTVAESKTDGETITITGRAIQVEQSQATADLQATIVGHFETTKFKDRELKYFVVDSYESISG